MLNLMKRDETDLAVGLIVGAILIPLLLVGMMAITVPLFGAMVRYRAHYRPLSVQLGQDKHSDRNEGGGQLDDPNLPQPTSLIGTLRRVKALEGWYGLYKGLYPMIAMIMVVLPIMMVAAAIEANHANGPFKTTSLGSAIVIAVLLIAVLPLQVLSIRSIVTPYRVSMSSLTETSKALLTASERANPLRMYTIPGLLSVTVFTALLATIVSWAGRQFIVGTPNGDNGDMGGRYVLLLLFRMVTALCMVPLDVVTIRLSVMPSEQAIGAEGRGSSEEEAALLAGSVALVPCSSGEAVINTRSHRYEGAVHCVKTVAQEEGNGALFRGWIWTLLGGPSAALG